MDTTEIFAFLNANPICYLATTEGRQPRVRGMMLYRADEQGLIFHAGQGKEMLAQMAGNPAVEICAFNPSEQVQVRVSGTVEFLEDLALKQEIVAAHPFLQAMIQERGYEALVVFRVKQCTATVWTMQTNQAPKSFVKLC